MLATNQSWQAKNITGQSSGAPIRTGQGVLHTVTLNKPVATSVLTIYDGTSTSGTKIATITVPASPMPVTLTYDVNYYTGLYYSLGTADMDVTISYS